MDCRNFSDLRYIIPTHPKGMGRLSIILENAVFLPDLGCFMSPCLRLGIGQSDLRLVCHGAHCNGPVTREDNEIILMHQFLWLQFEMSPCNSPRINGA